MNWLISILIVIGIFSLVCFLIWLEDEVNFPFIEMICTIGAFIGLVIYLAIIIGVFI